MHWAVQVAHARLGDLQHRGDSFRLCRARSYMPHHVLLALRKVLIGLTSASRHALVLTDAPVGFAAASPTWRSREIVVAVSPLIVPPGRRLGAATLPSSLLVFGQRAGPSRRAISLSCGARPSVCSACAPPTRSQAPGCCAEPRIIQSEAAAASSSIGTAMRCVAKGSRNCTPAQHRNGDSW